MPEDDTRVDEDEVQRTINQLEKVGKFTGKLEDRLDSPVLLRRGSNTGSILRERSGSTASTSMRKEALQRQASSSLAV